MELISIPAHTVHSILGDGFGSMLNCQLTKEMQKYEISAVDENGWMHEGNDAGGENGACYF